MAIYFHLFAFSIAKLTLATVLNFQLTGRAVPPVHHANARFIDFNLRLRSNYNYFEASSSLSEQKQIIEHQSEITIYAQRQ